MLTVPAESSHVQQVPTRQRFFWGLGGASDFLTYYSLNGLMDAIYVNAMALDPKIIGLARSVPRLLDLVTDPILGHLSDNTRSRWGRRRPWMAAGAILTALVAILMWYPPLTYGTWASTAYIVGMSVLVFTLGYSMFTIPDVYKRQILAAGVEGHFHAASRANAGADAKRACASDRGFMPKL